LIFSFINVGQLSLTFLILFQKLYNAAGDGDLKQDCLQIGADVTHTGVFVSIIKYRA
jgi:hypothetical protein